MKSVIPVVMAGIIAIYGLVVAVLITQNIKPSPTEYSLFKYVQIQIINLPTEIKSIYDVILRNQLIDKPEFRKLLNIDEIKEIN
jgi:hypothetical protein